MKLRKPFYNSEQVFAGNSDRHTVVTNELNPPIPEARFVKILPQEWERSVTLRFEILGCRVKGKVIVVIIYHLSIEVIQFFILINT